ncbi:hypothetical protein PYCC9005_001212 [Savitreella phatthalungensis]
MIRLPKVPRPKPSANLTAHHIIKGDKLVGFRSPFDSKTPRVPPSAFFRARLDGSLSFSNPKEDVSSAVGWQKPEFGGWRPGMMRVAWLGHASVYLELPNGVRVLCDPMFSQRCFAVQWAGPKRYTQPPATVEDLPHIDVVCISHNHYDHLDLNTVKQLHKKFDPLFMVSLRNKDWFTATGIEKVCELDWWEERVASFDGGREARFGYLPAEHMTGRGLHDQGATLWGSWVIEGIENKEDESGRKFFFTGDTAKCDVHKEIGQLRGPFDVAAVPIGAYTPRRLMRASHVDVPEAVEVYRDIRAKSAFAIHWATFTLSSEPWDEPREELRRLAPEGFTDWPMGELREV